MLNNNIKTVIDLIDVLFIFYKKLHCKQDRRDDRVMWRLPVLL
jgi:hypothetical protein